MPSQGPFSTAFLYYTDSTPNTEFAVPEGFVAVLRDFTGYTTAGGAIMQVLAQGDSSAPTIAVAQIFASGAPGYEQWTGRVVLPYPGIFSLFFSAVGAGPQVYAGGYLLRA